MLWPSKTITNIYKWWDKSQQRSHSKQVHKVCNKYKGWGILCLKQHANKSTKAVLFFYLACILHVLLHAQWQRHGALLWPSRLFLASLLFAALLSFLLNQNLCAHVNVFQTEMCISIIKCVNVCFTCWMQEQYFAKDINSQYAVHLCSKLPIYVHAQYLSQDKFESEWQTGLN